MFLRSSHLSFSLGCLRIKGQVMVVYILPISVEGKIG